MTRRTRVIAAAGGVVAICLSAAGCTRNDGTPPPGVMSQDAPSTQGVQSTSTDRVAIEFRSEPDPPEAGDNTFEVTVNQPAGSPITDATVTATFSMPAMPSMNMPAMRTTTTLAHDAAGRYRGTGQLSMSGTWNVTVTVSRGGAELGQARFSVVAK